MGRWLHILLLLSLSSVPLSLADGEIPMLLKLKAGVTPAKVVPEMLLGIQIVCSVFDHYGADCIITSMHDGKHGVNSLHSRDGLCRAVDFRTKHLTLNTKDLLIGDIKEALGENYDVVFEHAGEANEHLHAEYDPHILTTEV